MKSLKKIKDKLVDITKKVDIEKAKLKSLDNHRVMLLDEFNDLSKTLFSEISKLPDISWNIKPIRGVDPNIPVIHQETTYRFIPIFFNDYDKHQYKKWIEALLEFFTIQNEAGISSRLYEMNRNIFIAHQTNDEFHILVNNITAFALFLMLYKPKISLDDCEFLTNVETKLILSNTETI